jgi:hypothetical protein
MPGETQQAVQWEHFEWLNAMTAWATHLFVATPQVEFPLRWLAGSFIRSHKSLVTEFSETAKRTLVEEPPAQGIDGPGVASQQIARID